MRKILIFTGSYLPGHKDGGPLRTLINITETLGDDYCFHICCFDRDHGDTKSYQNIKYNCWNQVGKANVWYVPPKQFSFKLLKKLTKEMDLLYLCSFYQSFGYKSLILKKIGEISCPVYIASMGVFSSSALAHKSVKKKLFINLCKNLRLFDNTTWSVTSELEANDLKNVLGKSVNYVIAEDLPRASIPGRNKSWEAITKICFLSRICEHKGLDILIEAIKKMDNKAIEFTVYGPIEDQRYWDKCVALLNDSSINWSYKGDVPSEQVQHELGTQDILGLPTKSENYGHVIFEALSVGCIPIISDRTPWVDLEESGVGYICTLDSESFSVALDRFSTLTTAEKEIKSKSAVKYATEKVEYTRLHTGYRTIFDSESVSP